MLDPVPPMYTFPSPPGDEITAATSNVTDKVETITVESKPTLALETTAPLCMVALATVTVVPLTVPGPPNKALFPPVEVTVEEERMEMAVDVIVVPLSNQLEPAVLKRALERIWNPQLVRPLTPTRPLTLDLSCVLVPLNKKDKPVIVPD